MLYEMRTYSFLPTDLPKYLKHAEEVGRPVRGNDYGVNLGYWTSEFGRLNQVWHLWRYDSYAQREELRAKLSRNEDWTGKYVAVIKDWVKRQDIRILNPHMVFPRRREKGTFTSIVTTALSSAGSGPGLRRLRKRYRIARNTPNSPVSGTRKPDSRTKSPISGHIPVSTRGLRPARVRARMRVGAHS